jgi:hypothetical protein
VRFRPSAPNLCHQKLTFARRTDEQMHKLELEAGSTSAFPCGTRV